MHPQTPTDNHNPPSAARSQSSSADGGGDDGRPAALKAAAATRLCARCARCAVGMPLRLDAQVRWLICFRGASVRCVAAVLTGRPQPIVELPSLGRGALHLS